eukprot:2196569-Alexandrium_andersonii.AAC.1
MEEEVVQAAPRRGGGDALGRLPDPGHWQRQRRWGDHDVVGHAGHCWLSAATLQARAPGPFVGWR